ncbi:hypothetical protein ACTFTM_12030 [Micromonospora sp. RB23]
MTTRLQRQIRERRAARTDTPNDTPRAFARDVLINVLANLLAAGVVFLAAVAAGYVTASRVFIVIVALITVSTAAELLTVGLALDRQGKPASTREKIARALFHAVFLVFLLLVTIYGFRHYW